MMRSGALAAACGSVAGLLVLIAGVSGQEAAEVRVGARNLEGGWVELALQGRDAAGAWGGQALPSGRYLPPGAEGWKYSSPVTVSGAEVRAAVIRVERGVRLALQARGDSGSWGELQHPRARVLPRSVEGWRYSTALRVLRPGSGDGPLAAGAESAPADTGPGESAPPADGAEPEEESGAAGESSDENGGGTSGDGAAGADGEASSEGVPAPSGSAGAESDGGADGTGQDGESAAGGEDSEPAAGEIVGATDAEVLAAGWFADLRIGVRTGADGSSSFQLHVRGPWGTWRVWEMRGRLPADASGWRVTQAIGILPVDARTCLAGRGQGRVRIAALNEQGGVRVAVQAYRQRTDNWLERAEPGVQVAERRAGGHLTSTVRLALLAPGRAERAPGAGEMESEEDGGPVSDGRSRTPSECYQPRAWPPVATARIGLSQGRALSFGELIWSGAWESNTDETMYLVPGAEGWQHSRWRSAGALFPDTRERPWDAFVRVAWRLVDDERRVEAALQPWLAPGRWGELIEPFETFEIGWDGEGADQFGDPVALPVPEELPWPPSGWME